MALLDAAGLALARQRFESFTSASHLTLPGNKTNVENVIALQDGISNAGDTSLATGGSAGENNYIQSNPSIARQLKIIVEQVRRETL